MIQPGRSSPQTDELRKRAVEWLTNSIGPAPFWAHLRLDNMLDYEHWAITEVTAEVVSSGGQRQTVTLCHIGTGSTVTADVHEDEPGVMSIVHFAANFRKPAARGQFKLKDGYIQETTGVATTFDCSWARMAAQQFAEATNAAAQEYKSDDSRWGQW